MGMRERDIRKRPTGSAPALPSREGTGLPGAQAGRGGGGQEGTLGEGVKEGCCLSDFLLEGVLPLVCLTAGILVAYAALMALDASRL